MSPTRQDRLAMRELPPGRPVMRQRWNRLLFLHWPVEAELIAARLPAGLEVDTFDGVAWLGIVPFFMERVRPVPLPPVPGLSWFLELNVRTYVHDARGRPGVWFFSLDCNRAVAVEIARRCFHLPYRHAAMRARESDGLVHYSCRRKSPGAGEAVYAYPSSGDTCPAAESSLEWFLVERYLLFAADCHGRLHHGRVHHAPYRITPATCATWSAAPFAWNNLPVPDTPPTSILTADAVDVRVFPLLWCGAGT